jgi:hypothetical protein
MSEEALEQVKAALFNQVDITIDMGKDLTESEQQYLSSAGLTNLVDKTTGLIAAMEDPNFGPILFSELRAINVSLADNNETVVTWHGSSLEVKYAKKSASGSGSGSVPLKSKVIFPIAKEIAQNRIKNYCIPAVNQVVQGYGGPDYSMEVEVLWETFKDWQTVHALYRNQSKNSAQALIASIYSLCTLEPDILVDAVFRHVKKLCLRWTEGIELGDKFVTVSVQDIDSGKISPIDIKNLMLVMALQHEPSCGIYLLENVAMAPNVSQDGDLQVLNEVIYQPQFYFMEDKQEESVYEMILPLLARNEKILKIYSDLQKINRKGKKQERFVCITTKRYVTGDVDGALGKCKSHLYENIECIDVYDFGDDRNLGLCIWVKEELTKRGFGAIGGAIGGLPGLSGLPGLPGGLPSLNIDLPDMGGLDGLPSLSVPSISLSGLASFPGMPDLPGLPHPADLPTEFPSLLPLPDGGGYQREKQQKIMRSHPANKGLYSNTFIPSKKTSKETGILLIQELAWVVYAAWMAFVKPKDSYDKRPFYTVKDGKDNNSQVYDSPTEVLDLRHTLKPTNGKSSA